MRAVREFGVDVPKLCATDSMKPFGSCRLCVVEVEGRKGYPASCTTLIEPGMKIRTQTEALAKLRRNDMELYISDHPLDCLTCSANGDCELQDMAGAVGLREVRYGYDGENHLNAAIDESNPYFTFDPSKCIVCSRCVRACDEVQGTFALTIEGRRQHRRELSRFGMRLLRRLRNRVSDRNVDGQNHHRPRYAGSQRADNLRLLWRRVFLQGRDEGRLGRSYDAI
jgi:predicted molibdopterin-dependent oxidoreductase YjgC